MDAPHSESQATGPQSTAVRTPREFWNVAAAAVILAIAIGIANWSFVDDGSNGVTDSEITAMLQPLIDADKLTLYSFDGGDFLFASEKPGAEGEFYGCPVLGKVEMSDQRSRHAIADAVKVGIRDARAPAACFWPHHAIRAEKDGQTVDYIICFHCSNFRIYSGGALTHGGMTTNAAEKLLNLYLTDAGIPIGNGAAR